MTEQTKEEPTLDSLALSWFNAKAAENKAKDERLAYEADIIARAGAKPVGSQSVKTPDWKITTTGKMSHMLDVESFDTIASQIPAELHPVKINRSLDEIGYKWLKENRPDLFAIIATCVTTKPEKTSVTCVPLRIGQDYVDGVGEE